MPFTIIQGHQYRYQWKAHMQLFIEREGFESVCGAGVCAGVSVPKLNMVSASHTEQLGIRHVRLTGQHPHGL